MKKLILITVAFLAIQATAQEHKREHRGNKERGQKMMNLSAEDIATLQTKKMTLHLDLNESQQAKIQKINLENAKARKAAMEKRKAKVAEIKAKKESGEKIEKPTQEQRVKMANKMLDHKIATKKKMKEILNDEQYAKWEKAQTKMTQRGKSKMAGHRKGKGKEHQGKKKQ